MDKEHLEEEGIVEQASYDNGYDADFRTVYIGNPSESEYVFGCRITLCIN